MPHAGLTSNTLGPHTEADEREGEREFVGSLLHKISSGSGIIHFPLSNQAHRKHLQSRAAISGCGARWSKLFL